MFPWPAFGHISPFAPRKLVSIDSKIRVTFLTSAGTVPRVEAMLASSAKVTPLSLPHIPGLPSCASSTADLTADGAELLKLAVDATSPSVSALLADRPHRLRHAVGVRPRKASRRQGPLLRRLLRLLLRLHHRPLSPPVVRPRRTHGGPTRVPCHVGARHRASSPGTAPTSTTSAPSTGTTSACSSPDPPPPRHHDDEELDDRWATWLSAFPDASVIFASFGSETFLPAAAATELLLGLEATRSPFLAVLNFPKQAAMDDAAATELEAIIPVGLEERLEGRGVVHTGWVQQQQILRHRSVGCFVNHAGFSSVVEGLVAGCRLVMLPMKVEQHFNARLFARELRVGVEVARRDEDGWFGRQDVRDAVEAAVASGGGEEDDARKWREFFTNEDVQSKFAVDFVRELKEVVKGQA
ncbi:hypothetical protein HU200_039974 [Digitaria exilis]|uniref:Uncharacterized protein n=1 Tax=Digitaria exilis TaxID=1010633 RepID=A0A835BA78_9POAL|nr:hypothetical protein HU200_039974 [Digitaria exilis]